MAMAMPAHLGPWTEQDLRAMPDDGRRYEIVEGSLVVSPTPVGRHQWVARRLVQLLDTAAQPDLGAMEGFGVRIPGVITNYLVPDIVVGGRSALLTDDTGTEASQVQLVVEIVSPSSKFRDEQEKPLLYAKGGIPHLWRVEIKSLAVFVYRLSRNSYKEVTVARAGERLVVSEPFGISFDPAELVA
jgi:Uma2 family endonuclease